MALNTVTFSTNEDSEVHPKFIVVYLNNTYLPQETFLGNKGILYKYILQGARPLHSHHLCEGGRASCNIYIYYREHGHSTHTATALELVAATTP